MDIQKKEKVLKLISDGEIEVAFEEMLSIEFPISDIKNRLVMQSSLFNTLKKEKLDGIINREDFQVQFSRIVSSMLNIISSLEHGIKNRNEILETRKPNEIKYIDLNSELRPTQLTLSELDTIETFLFFSEDSITEEKEFVNILQVLEEDKSTESITLLKKLIFWGEPIGKSSFGVNSLARTGKCAIPEIIEVLLSGESKRVLYMLDNLFGENSITYYYDVSAMDASKFIRELIMNPKWPEVLINLEKFKKDASKEMVETIEKLITRGKYFPLLKK